MPCPRSFSTHRRVSDWLWLPAVTVMLLMGSAFNQTCCLPWVTDGNQFFHSHGAGFPESLSTSSFLDPTMFLYLQQPRCLLCGDVRNPVNMIQIRITSEVTVTSWFEGFTWQREAGFQTRDAKTHKNNLSWLLYFNKVLIESLLCKLNTEGKQSYENIKENFTLLKITLFCH